MGYYTQIFVRIENEDGTDNYDDLDSVMKEFRDRCDIYMCNVDVDIMGYTFQLQSEEPNKLYDFDADMEDLSKVFPDLVFTVIGAGEDTFDRWYQHWKNGVTDGPHTIHMAFTPWRNRQP